mgnify:CR=1 FL=1
MRLNVVTLANTALAEASDGELDLKSTDQALLVLDTESDYYNILYNAAKIKKYAQTKASSDDSQAKKNIIQRKQEEAVENRKEAEGSSRTPSCTPASRLRVNRCRSLQVRPSRRSRAFSISWPAQYSRNRPS